MHAHRCLVVVQSVSSKLKGLLRGATLVYFAPTLESALSEESWILPEGVSRKQRGRTSVACVHLPCACDITLVVTIWIQAYIEVCVAPDSTTKGLQPPCLLAGPALFEKVLDMEPCFSSETAEKDQHIAC